ncbi:hypothetical protein ABEX25_23570 [Paenibacillus thiaminolyticus]|uniref:hypothetical protein n=1 Tax=Paenibacillus thiaminolyticus TaxID=49283 RepID=UPI003D2E82D8
MAKVGDVLKQPENGWYRYDDRDEAIQYIPSDGWSKLTLSDHYLGTSTGSSTKSNGNKFVFSFVGTKLRLILSHSTTYTDKIQITIDNKIVEFFSAKASSFKHQILSYEKIGLSYGKHDVEVTTATKPSNSAGADFRFDALDIDDNGWLIKHQKFLIQASNKKTYTIIEDKRYKEIVRSDNRNNINIINDGFSNPENAFDKYASNSADTLYTSPLKKIGFKSENKIRVEKINVHLTSRYGTKLELEGSDDGVKWVKLNETNFANYNLNSEILIKNTRDFYYYRIVFYGLGSFSISLKELQFYFWLDNKYLMMFESANDDVFIQYGLKKGETISFSEEFVTRIFFVDHSTSLGTGKVLKQKINTSKIPIKKVTIE